MRKGDDFKGIYRRTPCQAIDGVIPLYNIPAKVCDQHGGVKEVQYSPQCKERPHLQLKRGKDIITT